MHRGADDLGLEREPVAVAAHELHHRLDPALQGGDRDGEGGGMGMRRGVVSHVHRVHPLAQRLEPPLHLGHAAAVHHRQLGGERYPAGAELVL